ncbi:hypothetical protein OVS_02200 [Mycoplasma ovis str. Michigan]|uniref:Uncharacterized protein n=1 Tax=Mycoplasma ovis str. Michigan TaxID=1415773 RepID=A0ABN4BLK6_9MOLU|nr:hypothetical protein [Mycoplasma ovis]AHC40301.1 hypothetical protein OVS_02200 [Mycoplasma ovis str. Michigan]
MGVPWLSYEKWQEWKESVSNPESLQSSSLDSTIKNLFKKEIIIELINNFILCSSINPWNKRIIKTSSLYWIQEISEEIISKIGKWKVKIGSYSLGEEKEGKYTFFFLLNPIRQRNVTHLILADNRISRDTLFSTLSPYRDWIQIEGISLVKDSKKIQSEVLENNEVILIDFETLNIQMPKISKEKILCIYFGEKNNSHLIERHLKTVFPHSCYLELVFERKEKTKNSKKLFLKRNEKIHEHF